jgi:hypothetical protein
LNAIKAYLSRFKRHLIICEDLPADASKTRYAASGGLLKANRKELPKLIGQPLSKQSILVCDCLQVTFSKFLVR